MKVTIVGAGNVGSTCADAIAFKRIASEVVLLDIKENFAEGKALDMTQTSSLLGFNTKIVGSTNDYSKTAESDVVVVTSGIPRKPGMTREELIGVNAGIVKTVTNNILEHSQDAVIVSVSNPMDTIFEALTTPDLKYLDLNGITHIAFVLPNILEKKTESELRWVFSHTHACKPAYFNFWLYSHCLCKHFMRSTEFDENIFGLYRVKKIELQNCKFLTFKVIFLRQKLSESF